MKVQNHCTTVEKSEVSVLGVSGSVQVRRAINLALTQAGWSCRQVDNCTEALKTIEATGARVVVTDTNLSDGTWRDLVDAARQQPDPPAVVVTSPHADEALWTDVIEHGAFDLVRVPGESTEFLRVVRLAFGRGAVVGRATA
ncbi:MAG: response regulator [Bryobacterales bacterium]|nr:response regulator [Bryobacterales bacterium]